MLNILFFTGVVLAFGNPGDEPRPAPKAKEQLVELSITSANDFPKSCPVVLRVQMKNIGQDAIRWWSGGPDRYPGAERFIVEIRYGSGPWNEVQATNGQYTQGSGIHVSIRPGESIEVPLAIPLKNSSGVEVDVRVRPREWKAAKDAEQGLIVQDHPKQLDEFRARLIAAGVHPATPFETHLAETYADAVVIDSLIRLMELENQAIRTSVTKVLAAQRELPVGSSAMFVKAIRECSKNAVANPATKWPWLMTAALRTEGEEARATVLGLLDPSNPALCKWASDAVRLSPGNETWLRRARESLIAAEKAASAKDADLAKSIQRDIKWLDSRINQGKR